jgi:hypothetical protein
MPKMLIATRPPPEPVKPVTIDCVACGGTQRDSTGHDCWPCKKNGRIKHEATTNEGGKHAEDKAAV